jgi:hypothetical protein
MSTDNVPQVTDLVVFLQRKIDAVNLSIKGLQIPTDKVAKAAYWRKIASNAETIRTFAEALETEARKHL